MTIQMKLFTPVLVLGLFLFGCNGSNTPNPVIPSNDASEPSLTTQTTPEPQNITWLWGYYDLVFDVESREVEVTPDRSTAYTVNIVKFLNSSPTGLGVSFNGTTVGTGYVDIDLDVTIKHPIDNVKYNGYDVRGIFIANGSGTTQYNPSLHMAEKGTDQVLMNADGYSRWFNKPEFTSSGIFGYTQGLLASQNYNSTATLNPYKYFGQDLDATENLWTYLTSGGSKVGYFVHGSTNTRNYQIRFPIPVPGVKYGYAITANWEGGQPQFHPSHAPEAVGIKLVDNSTLYYVNQTENGGQLVLDISIFDWFSELTGNAMEDYDIFLESDVLSDTYELTGTEMQPSASGNHFHTYHVEVDADNVESTDGNELWVFVEYPDHNYKNPFNIPNQAGTEPLVSAFRFDLTVGNDYPPSITLIQPNGGETWSAGTSHEILWTSVNASATVGLQVSTNSGANYSPLTAQPVDNDGSYTWDPIPTSVSGTHTRIKIVDAGITGVFAESDADFTVTMPYIQVTSPNGGENWLAGSAQTITWTSQGINSTVKIIYSTDNFFSSFVTISDLEENDGEFIWPSVPKINSQSVKVRISTAVGEYFEDASDNNFTIFFPTIHLTSPNGGESWAPGTVHNITWDSTNLTGNILIQYSTDGFASDVNEITPSTPNNGTYSWTVPYDPSDTVKVRVRSVSFPTVMDSSDAEFTIKQPTIEVTSPNGGEEIQELSTFEVTWISTSLAGNVDIEASPDNFVSEIWDLGLDQPNTGSFMWDLECGPDSAINIRVKSTSFPALFDISDAPFDIYETGWAATYGDTEDDQTICTATDSEGNTWLGGYTKSGGQWDFHLSKLSPCGEYLVIWEWGTGTDQIIQGIDVDENDNVYVAGYFQGTNVDFDPSDGVDLHSSNFNDDCFLMQFDSEGNYVWSGVWGSSTGSDRAYDVSCDDSGSVYVTGYFWGSVDFDPGPGTNTKNAGTNTHGYVTKFNTSNVHQWVNIFGGTTSDVQPRGVSAKGAANVSITGHITGTDADFDPGAGSALRSSNGSWDMFTVVLNSDGLYQWVVTAGSTESDVGLRTTFDNFGNVFVGGYFQLIVDFDPGAGTANRTSNGSTDAYLLKLDSTGAYQWVATWGAADGDTTWAIRTTSSDVYVVGGFNGSPDFDPDPVDTLIIASNGSSDASLSSFTLAGDLNFVRTWGSTGTDGAAGLSIAPNNNIVVSGWFTGTDTEFAPTGDPCFNASDTHSSIAGYDMYVVKYLSDGCW